jgi:hypothetical protein
MMVGSNLKDTQLQQIVDKTILFHVSFESKIDVLFYSDKNLSNFEIAATL